MSKKCTPLWREAHFEVKMLKTPGVWTTFGSWDVEKVHAVVARSTFPSQNVTKHTILGPRLEVEMSKKCTPLWREAHFQVKMYKALGVRTTFGNSNVEKVHAVVARSTFRSQNVQNTPFSDHFWKLRCQKSARRCGAKHISKSKCTKHTSASDHFWKLRCRKSVRRCSAKHISKSKCTKHTSVGPLLEVEMSKKCTPLWREAHFQVKMYKTPFSDHFWEVEMLKKCTPLWREAHFQVKMHKTHQRRTTFGSWEVEKVYAVVARSTFPSQNVQSTPASDHFWKLRCRKSVRRCSAKHISKSKCTKHTILGPLLEVEMSKKCTPLWREAHFEVKMYKTHHSRTTFGSWDVKKVHAVVARSTFPSQNAQNTHQRRTTFGSWDVEKSVRRCSAKHISKSKCTKHTSVGPLLEVEMSKKCTPLWREAHFKVKMLKTPCSDHFWKLRCRKKCTPL